MRQFLWFVPIVAGVVFLSCKKQQPVAPQDIGSIQVNSTPTGAGVWLDNTDTGKKANCLLENISVGDHSIKLSLESYSDYITSVKVEKNKTATINATLTPNTGSIQVNSTPPGADIWLDGDTTGYKTNYLLQSVSLGEHSIKLTLQGYADYCTTVTICENETTTVNTMLTPTLTITASGVRVNNNTETTFTYRFSHDNHLNHLYITFPGYPQEYENPADVGDKVANTDYHSYWQNGGAEMPTGTHVLRFVGTFGGSAYEMTVNVDVQ